MKKIIKSLAVLGAVLLAFTGCKEDELPVFSGDNNIYFNSAKWPSGSLGYQASMTYENNLLNSKVGSGSIQQAVDSTTISMAFLSAEQKSDTTFMPVKLIGRPASYDRKINYKVVKIENATENVDFKVLDAFIPANSVIGGIVVEVFRANVGQGVYGKVEFELLENENFKINYPLVNFSATDTTKTSTLKMKLRWTDGLEPPTPGWKYSEEGKPNTTTGHTNLGEYSARKMFVLHDHLAVKWENVYKEDGSSTVGFYSYADAYGTMLYTWLGKYKVLHGVPYYEEDGETEMKAGAKHYK